MKVRINNSERQLGKITQWKSTRFNLYYNYKRESNEQQQSGLMAQAYNKKTEREIISNLSPVQTTQGNLSQTRMTTKYLKILTS